MVCEGQTGISCRGSFWRDTALPIKITTGSLSKFPHLVLTIYSCLSNSQVLQETSYLEAGRWPAYSKQATKVHLGASQKLQDVFSLKITTKVPPPQLARHEWPALFAQHNWFYSLTIKGLKAEGICTVRTFNFDRIVSGKVLGWLLFLIDIYKN